MEREVIRQLFLQHYARMQRVARSLLYDEQECEDEHHGDEQHRSDNKERAVHMGDALEDKPKHYRDRRYNGIDQRYDHGMHTGYPALRVGLDKEEDDRQYEEYGAAPKSGGAGEMDDRRVHAAAEESEEIAPCFLHAWTPL